MRAWLALPAAELLALPAETVAERLTFRHADRFRALELAQRTAWVTLTSCLRNALGSLPHAGWSIAFEYDLLRLEKRIDAVLLTDRAIFVIECKDAAGGYSAAALRQAEDYALDLHDFHAGSRAHPIIPVLLVPAGPRPPAPRSWLIPHGVLPTSCANAASIGPLLAEVQHQLGPPATPLDGDRWLRAAYRPVPNVLEAAAMLFDRHRSAEMRAARADADSLNRTVAAVRRAIAAARAARGHTVVFVTGIPGAGKTLCGMEIAFSQARQRDAGGAAFLTGNAPLVDVLRADLIRQRAPAGSTPGHRQEAKREAGTVLQNVHRFLEQYAQAPDALPPERVIVFDEAQRAWDARQATKNTQRRTSHLRMSEPAHTLEIMGRHPDWAVIVALIGNGQEINTGEAGLQEWGRVIAAAPAWRAVAPSVALAGAEPAQCLADGPRPWLALDDALALTVPMRSVRSASAGPWVDAVLAGDAARAARIADDGGGVPYLLTRELDATRLALRRLARGLRRAGLVASSGARRLRADGLGAELDDVARWFLDRWPDVRASDALETFATEYACQGLELDFVGLAWGGDFRRAADGWSARSFHGDRWKLVRGAEEARFIRNTYRVLLTRARYETVIWVPRGSAAGPWFDATRDPAWLDATADFLLACGAQPLGDEPPTDPPPQPALL